MSITSLPLDPVPTFPEFKLPGSVDTPAVVVDLARLERNIEQMAAEMRSRAVALRPHAKTHNSSAIASLQREAGATGLAVGTLRMAQAFAGHGVDDIFLAAPLWPGPGRAGLLRALHEAVGLTVGVDSAEGAQLLGQATSGSSSRLAVMIEVDSGERRSGVRCDQVAALARVSTAAGLRVAGAFTHGGHGYRGTEYVADAANDEIQALACAAEALREEGFDDVVLSAGSTPTVLLSAVPPVTEERPGTYVFNDRQQVALGSVPPDRVALAVAATVISTAVPGQIVLDAGAKTLAKDRPARLAGHGMLPAYPDGLVTRIYDFHAVVEFSAGTARPSLGEVVAVVPNHVCPVVNLARELVLVRDGDVRGRWEIDARG